MVVAKMSFGFRKTRGSRSASASGPPDSRKTSVDSGHKSTLIARIVRHAGVIYVACVSSVMAAPIATCGLKAAPVALHRSPGIHLMTDNSLKFLQIGEGTEQRAIAVRRHEGALPGLFWLSGYKSDMKGTKAEALAHGNG